MKNITYALIAIFALFLGACSPSVSPFNQRLIDQNSWEEAELKEIQFYLSKDIILYKNYTNASSKIESGEIKMVNGRKIEEIKILKGTPGIALFQPKNNRLAVSFENKGTDKFLIFGPNPKKGNKYVLLASEWKNQRGKVKYDDQTYYTNVESSYATLMVDLKESKKIKVSSRAAKGRKIK